MADFLLEADGSSNEGQEAAALRIRRKIHVRSDAERQQGRHRWPQDSAQTPKDRHLRAGLHEVELEEPSPQVAGPDQLWRADRDLLLDQMTCLALEQRLIGERQTVKLLREIKSDLHTRMSECRASVICREQPDSLSVLPFSTCICLMNLGVA